MEGRLCYKEVLPFCAMVALECISVGGNVLFEEATKNGLSHYAFIFYSYAVSTLFLLLPLPFNFRWSRGLPPLKLSLIFRIFLLGLIGFVAQLSGYKGLQYTSPTLFSALSNLMPAFTFILAVFFRMEKVIIRSSSTQAKIVGSTVSILGALIVVLYKGPVLFLASAPDQSPHINSPMGSTSQQNWILGGFLLAIEFILVPVWYILQTKVMKEFPAEVIVVFFYCLCGALISAPVCLLLDEANLSGWKLNLDTKLIAVLYSGFFLTGMSSLVHTWGLHLKGPVYISIFKPLSIPIAAVMSAIFLGDSLYLGTVAGAVILSLGFYAVIWGKAKEELIEDFDLGRTQPTSNDSKTPLLRGDNVIDNS